jgi:hypothetical protein
MSRILLWALLLTALLTGVASKGVPLSALWDAAGCEADPFGCSAPQPKTDAGCEMDPDGRCRPGS